MNNFFLFMFCLLSLSLSSYLPMKKKDIGYGENICSFTYSSITYVKPCKDNGKYCNLINDLGVCQDIPTKIALLGNGEKCNSDFECEEGLNCFGTCTTAASASAVNVCYDTNHSPLKRENGWECIHNNYKDYCKYYDATNSIYESASADYFQVCGAIEFKTTTHTGNLGTTYEDIKIASNYIGTQKAGTFVEDSLACESGFALYFFPNGSSKEPYTGSAAYGVSNKLYLMCVDFEDIEYRSSTSCTIKYDNGKLYNVDLLDNIDYPPSPPGSSQSYYKYSHLKSELCKNSEFLKTKLELFKKYIEVFTKEKQENCAKPENYNEPRTCNDNQIRKWYYLYNNPEIYIEYYDDDLKYNDVITYLIQQEYPSYQISKFLNMNYFICLLFLFLFL